MLSRRLYKLALMNQHDKMENFSSNIRKETWAQLLTTENHVNKNSQGELLKNTKCFKQALNEADGVGKITRYTIVNH